MLDRAAERFGTRDALTYAGRHWSWQALQEDCDRAAQGLIHCGIQAGEHIALWLTNRPEAAYLVCRGQDRAVLVPINTRFRSMDLEYVLRQSESTTLVTTDHSGPIGYLDMVRHVIPELDICTTPPGAQIPAADLIVFCRGKIASFKVPRHVLVMHEYPMTASGKVQKVKLRELSMDALGLPQA